MIRWFRDIGLADRPSVGGKAASLGELERAGINVPPGFAVATEAFGAFMAVADPRGELRARADALRPGDASAIAAFAREARSRIEATALPPAIRDRVTGGYAQLCGATADAPVAVRSSATSEDSDEASFAGLQDTYLWVRGAEQVLTQLRRCWASLYSEPALSYRRRLRIPEAGAAMAVVVQRMVRARCAGVVFTRSPTTGDRSVLAVEASWGLGSALVSGEVTPDRYVVSKVTLEITKRTISCKSLQHVADGQGGVRAQEVPLDLRGQPCLSDAQLRELAQVAKRIELHYGKPQDIEWAIDGAAGANGTFFFLQSRPETVWAGKSEAPIARPAANPLEHVLAALSGRSRPRS